MKIVYFSDFDIKGSGYRNISIPLCRGLAEAGHDIKAIGLAYKGEEHNFPFSILPCASFTEGGAMIHNLRELWKPDVMISAADVPWHEIILQSMHTQTKYDKPLPYIGIFPIESDPVCLDWAMILMQMQAQLCISEFGKDECLKMNIPAEHLQIGVDVDAWRMPSPEERKSIREALGYDQDDFVILTVADNQERKNLGRELEAIAEFRKKYKGKVKFALVTREHLKAGWRLRTFASQSHIALNDIFQIYERGLSFKELWSLYAIADVFLLLSRSEGLGMPILEAMSTGVPCVATGACAFLEHLADGAGYLIPPSWTYPDPFGNANRYMVDAKSVVDVLVKLAVAPKDEEVIKKARAYVEKRQWDIAIKHLEKVIKRVVPTSAVKSELSKPDATTKSELVIEEEENGKTQS